MLKQRALDLPQQLISEIDWLDEAFSIRAAYVSSVFSELVYWAIAETELEDIGRASLVPCFTYQRLIRERDTEMLPRWMAERDLAQFVIIPRKFAVALVVRFTNVVFVSIRGTSSLYDWRINLNARKLSVGGGMAFHRGFLRALVPLVSDIEAALAKYYEGGVPVYITGHSLGGAMAAILNSRPTLSIRHADNGWWGGRYVVNARGCYTFGMPRYGNFASVIGAESPFHFYGERDLVPKVPPKWLGYSDCATEYRMDGQALERSGREPTSFVKFIALLVSGKGIKHHSIELYREKLGKLFSESC